MQPVLDHGSVEVISSSMSVDTVRDLVTNYNINDFNILSDNINIVIKIKCPIFVRIYMSKFGLTFYSKIQPESDSYIPNTINITKDIEVANNIRQAMVETVDALTLNVEGFKFEGCDDFTSQIQLPISMYNTLIVVGSLQKWLNLIKAKNLPYQLEAYRSIIDTMIKCEWKEFLTDGR